VHTLSVSLNKIGDLRYYDGDLQSARSYYARSLAVRRNSVKEHSAVASQVISMLSVMVKHESFLDLKQKVRNVRNVMHTSLLYLLVGKRYNWGVKIFLEK
jgi:hypothetical protein